MKDLIEYKNLYVFLEELFGKTFESNEIIHINWKQMFRDPEYFRFKSLQLGGHFCFAP